MQRAVLRHFRERLGRRVKERRQAVENGTDNELNIYTNN